MGLFSRLNVVSCSDEVKCTAFAIRSDADVEDSHTVDGGNHLGRVDDTAPVVCSRGFCRVGGCGTAL